MTRARLRAGILAAVLFGLGALAFMVGRVVIDGREESSRDLARTFVPEVDQRIEGFHRVSVRAGGRTFELSADEARYDEDARRVEVSSPRVVFFDDEVGEIRLAGREGQIVLDGEEMERVDLRGDVELSFRDFVLRVPSAFYARAADTIVAPDGVTITGSDLDLTGDSLVVNVETHRMHVVGDVYTLLRPAALEGQTFAGPEAVAAGGAVGEEPADQESKGISLGKDAAAGGGIGQEPAPVRGGHDH